MGAGAKVFLNSYCEGALLFAGDVHTSQGDAEYIGKADECRAQATLECSVIKNRSMR